MSDIGLKNWLIDLVTSEPNVEWKERSRTDYLIASRVTIDGTDPFWVTDFDAENGRLWCIFEEFNGEVMDEYRNVEQEIDTVEG